VDVHGMEFKKVPSLSTSRALEGGGSGWCGVGL
jgi:hypothetical protein